MIRVAGRARPGRRRPERPGPRRPDAVAGDRRAARADRRPVRPPDARLRRASCARSWPRTASTSSASTTSRSSSGEQLAERFSRQIFPVLTPLAVGVGRPFPYISNLSLSLAVLVRDPQTGVRTFARVKVPEGDAPALPPGRRGRPDVRRARAGHRRAPAGALPRDGGRRQRRVPRDARRRLRGLRRGRRPARGGRGRAAPPPLRRGRAPRDQRRHERRAARGAHAGPARRGAAGLRGRGPARLHRPLADRQAARLRRAARPAVDAGHPAAAAGRRRPSGVDMFEVIRQGDVLVHHPYDSFVDLGRALRRAGGRGPRRPGDQDDRVPHVATTRRSCPR